MRTPQSKLSSVTQTLQEEAEDKIQDTRLWASQTGIHTDTIKLTMVSKWYRILDDLLWEHLTFIMKKICNVTRGTQYPLTMGHTVRPGIIEHCKKLYNVTFMIYLHSFLLDQIKWILLLLFSEHLIYLVNVWPTSGILWKCSKMGSCESRKWQKNYYIFSFIWAYHGITKGTNKNNGYFKNVNIYKILFCETNLFFWTVLLCFFLCGHQEWPHSTLILL